MTLKDFLKQCHGIDVSDNQDISANEIRNSLYYNKVQCPFEKDLKDLTDDEIHAVFYPVVAGKVNFYTEIVDKAKKEMEGYL